MNAECNSIWEVINGSLKGRDTAFFSEAIKKLIRPLRLLGQIGLLNEIGKLMRAHEGVCVCVYIISLIISDSNAIISFPLPFLPPHIFFKER